MSVTSTSATSGNKRKVVDLDANVASGPKRLRSISEELSLPSTDASSISGSEMSPPVSGPSSPVSTASSVASAGKPTTTKKSSRRKRSAATTTRKPNRFRGICWLPDRHSWRARIEIGGKREHLGYFATPEEAAHAYDQRAVEHYGAAVGFLNFATNHPHHQQRKQTPTLSPNRGFMSNLAAAAAAGAGVSPASRSVGVPVFPTPSGLSLLTVNAPTMNKSWSNNQGSSSGSSSPTDLAQNALRDLLAVSHKLQLAKMQHQRQQQQQQQFLTQQQQQAAMPSPMTSSADVLSRMLAVENNKRCSELQQQQQQQRNPLSLQERLEAEIGRRAMEQQRHNLNVQLARHLELRRQLEARVSLARSQGQAATMSPSLRPGAGMGGMFNSLQRMGAMKPSSAEMARLHQLILMQQQQQRNGSLPSQ